jgi:hypothetical protein
MKKYFSVLVLLAFLGTPIVQAISPAEVNDILQKKRDPYLQSILKAHKRAVKKRTTGKSIEIKGGLWRNTLSTRRSAVRTRPSYTADSFRNKSVRTPEMLQGNKNKYRTGITRRSINQPRLWSRRRTENKDLRIRKFSRGGDGFKINSSKGGKRTTSEQQSSYLKRKMHHYTPLDSE